jgi:hypothetical protein
MAKLAYIVLPTYDWSGYASDEQEKKIIRVLEKCNLMPSSLRKYGRKEDVRMFENILASRGFDVHTDDGFCTTRKKMLQNISELIRRCSDDSVLVIIFCGHGETELGTRHASLVMSDNKRVTSSVLDEELSKAQGSVFTVLNCCTAAGGVPIVLPQNSPELINFTALTDDSTGHFSLAGKRRVEVFSATHVEVQKASVTGTRLAHAFSDIFHAYPDVTVECMGALLTDYWDAKGWSNAGSGKRTTPTVLCNNYTGTMFGTLKEEPKAEVRRLRVPKGNIVESYYDSGSSDEM